MKVNSGVWIGLAGWLLAVSGAYAAEDGASDGQDKSLPEDEKDPFIVEVVGDAPEDRQSYPGSVVIMEEEDIDRLAPLSANEVLNTVSGVHVVDEEGIGLRPNIGIRGLNPNRSRKVLVLEDGIPIALAPYGEPELYYAPPIERMERIEVVKGSGSVLFGPQTIGGVVNYITRDPPEQTEVATRLRVGAYDLLFTELSVGTGNARTGLRIDGFHKRYGGPRDLNLVVSDLSGKWVARLDGHRVWVKFDAYQETSGATYLGLTTPMFEANPRQNPAIHDVLALGRLAVAGGHTVHNEQGHSLQSTVYFHAIHREWWRQDLHRLNQGLAYEREVSGVPGQPALDDGSSVFFLDQRTSRDRAYQVMGLEERLVVPWFGKDIAGEWSSGVRLHREGAVDQRVQALGVTATDGTVLEAETRGATALAGWMHHRFVIGSNLQISPGLRYESIWSHRSVTRTRQEDASGNITPVDVEVTERDHLQALIPGMGVSWEFQPGWTAYAGVHRGFAPPRTKDSISSDGQVLELEAEHSWNWELGARVQLPSGLQAECTGFMLDFSNQVVPPAEAAGALIDPAQQGMNLVNGARTVHVGGEISGRGDLGEAAGWSLGLPVQANYTLVYAHYRGGAYDGNWLPYAPQHQVTLGAGVSLTQGWSLNGVVRHTSAQFTDPENTLFASIDGLRGQIGARTTLDARLDWDAVDRESTRVSVFVAGKNLVGPVGMASRAPQGIQPTGFRSVLAGVDASWGKH